MNTEQTTTRFDLIQGNALEVLKQLPDESIQMCITSPPYYLMRQYGTDPQVWDAEENCEHVWGDVIPYSKQDNRTPEEKKAQNCGVGNNTKTLAFTQGTSGNFCTKCPAWKGELGLEPSVNLYIKHLIQIFAEVKRVIKKDGLIVVNLGDTFQGSGKGFGGNDPKWNKARDGKLNPRVATNTMQRKSLMSVPSRFEIAAVDELDLVLRNEVIWHKINGIPSPAKDRFSIDHEKLFVFSKQPKYKFNQQLEPYTTPVNRWGGEEHASENESVWDKGTGQNTYRQRKVRPNPEGRNVRTVWSLNYEPKSDSHFASYPTKLIEIPILAGTDEGDIVLDPFAGSGTTAVVALKHNRDFIGIELLPEYIEIINKRINGKTMVKSCQSNL